MENSRLFLKATITLILVLFTSSGFAEDMEHYIDRHTEQICAESNLVLNLQEIGGILDSSGLSDKNSKIQTCNVWENTYYISVKDSSFTTNDGYSGPVLLIKMIADGGKGVLKLDHGIMSLREDMVCIKQDGNRIFMAYNLESSNTEGFWGVKTHFRKILFQFEENKLVWAGQVIRDTKAANGGGLESSSEFFQLVYRMDI